MTKTLNCIHVFYGVNLFTRMFTFITIVAETHVRIVERKVSLLSLIVCVLMCMCDCDNSLQVPCNDIPIEENSGCIPEIPLIQFKTTIITVHS